VSQPLRKTIKLPLPNGEEVSIDITFRQLEVIERVWNKGLDAVIVELSSAGTIRRYLIADVIAQWVPLGSSGLSSVAIKEAVMLSPPEKFSMYAAMVLTVASYALSYIKDDDFMKATDALTGRLKPGPGAQTPPKKERRRPSSKQPTK